MPNELLIILNLIILYSAILIWYRLFNTRGLYCFMIFATLTANIEVLILVNAFGIEQTLGNVLFACTFLITDIISETEGKKAANTVANIGIATSVLFIIVSQMWMLYTPSENDRAFEPIKAVFTNTPRVMAVSILVYAITQKFDVWLYHKWWNYTTRKFKDSTKMLWLRNNGSTMISQLLNTVLFTIGSFIGLYSIKTLVNISVSSYAVFFIAALLDTPVIYLARKMNSKKSLGGNFAEKSSDK